MAEEVKDILDIIKSRRSITKYLPRPVDWEHVSKIIDAGRHAPSCGNLQNWRFIVVLDPSKRKALSEAALQQYWMLTAPVHIVVCGEPEKAERYYGLRGERLYTVQNCAAAIENMLLEAHSLGLGACWVGAFDEEMVKRAIRAEEFLRPQAILTIGFAAEVPPKPPKYPMNMVMYFNNWRGTIKDPIKYMRDYALIWQKALNQSKEKVKGAIESASSKLRGYITDLTQEKNNEEKK